MKSKCFIIAIFAAITLSAILPGCVTTDYVGKTYAQTSHVDLYFSETDITRAYEVMGSVRSSAPGELSFEEIQEELMKEAMAKGADAILIEDMNTVTVGSTTSTQGKGNGDNNDRWSSSSNTTERKEKILAGKLIKYK